jgi:hypothetical protein
MVIKSNKSFLANEFSRVSRKRSLKNVLLLFVGKIKYVFKRKKRSIKSTFYEHFSHVSEALFD